MTRHIVLGSDGFIGKYFSDWLKSQGKKVVGYDIKRNTNEDCGLINLKLKKDDIVYFLAWDVGGAKYLYNNQISQIKNNIDLMKNVFNQLECCGCKFIFISSQLSGTDSAYGSLKHLGETWTSQLPRGRSIRLWNVYGAYESLSERSHVVSDLIHQALINEEMFLISTGEEKRQFIHINDICEAIIVALKSDDKNIYDVTSFEWVRVIDVARIIAKYLNCSIYIGNSIGTTQNVPIKGKLPNWCPKVKLEQGIGDTIRLYKERLRG